jgi:crotonobetainyl-CoA:carnitine CoA-transferase CaiB-like acyl-CoA transferase
MSGEPQALSAIRVLDLSRVLAGPWCSQLLADLGAEVIKVERPGKGDDTRGWGPPYLRDQQGEETSESAYFLSANRGKQSIAIDITRPEGQELIRGLAKRSDIFLENFKLGGLAKYGLDYPSLKEINPRLIYCSITGFGQDGPSAHRPGYDFMIQALGGLMSITGERDDEPGGGPQKAGVALADILTGLYATAAVLAALNHRHQSGQGQCIDLALLDVQVACLANQAMNYLVSGEPPQRLGNAHPNIVPYQAFAASDGHFILAVGNDGQFGRLCDLLDQPQWKEDPRYATNAARVRNRQSLIPKIREYFEKRRVTEWLADLDRLSIPGGPINTLDSVFANPQIRHRGMQTELPHPLAGTVPLVNNPIRLSASPVRLSKAPPCLGEHTADVLQRLLELDETDLDALRSKAII